ncbi:MAG TPA: hypothetical protein VGQ19_18755, partial [Burkholderiales bacterium]|nr:hypothetical protein [Burkholderiales bacterium]
DQIRRLCSVYRVAFFGADEARRAGIPTQTLEEALAQLTGKDMEIPEGAADYAADYQEKYGFLASGACTHLRAQQKINGTSSNSTVEKEVP